MTTQHDGPAPGAEIDRLAEAREAAPDCDPDAELRSLEAELHRRRDEHLLIDRSQVPAFKRRDATGDNTEIDAIGDRLATAGARLCETEDRIAATPARTVAGIAVKLRLGAVHARHTNRSFEDEDLETQIMLSACEDAERLAKGGTP